MIWLIGIGAVVLVLAVLATWIVVADRKKTLALHQKHAQPPEREQLLAFGALMLLRNGEDTRIVHIKESRENLRDGLIEYWDIADAKTARETIQSLIVEGRRAHFQADFTQLQDGASLGQLKSFDGEDYLRWESAVELWKKEGLALSPDAVATMAAFDYERIAWLARCCFHLGYISEPEMWRCLAWVAERARAEFPTWADYAASYVFGRAATYDDKAGNDAATSEGIRAAKELLTEKEPWFDRPHIWQSYPLAQIAVPADLPAAVDEAVERIPAQREQLLGFGALMAAANEEPASALAIQVPDRNNGETWLAQAWHVADAAMATERIEWVLENCGRTDYGHAFRDMATGAKPTETGEIDAAAHVRYRHAKDRLVAAGLAEDCVFSCQTILAYELERAAYLNRLAFAIGYLDEERAWNYQRRIATLARAAFNDWQEYLVSFLLAQATFNSDERYLRDLIRNGLVLLNIRSPFAEHASLWQRHPLDSMTVLHAIRQVGAADQVASETGHA